MLLEPSELFVHAAQRRWGNRLLGADLATDLAEAMVAWALPRAWRRRGKWPDGGFFEHDEGTLLETIACTALDHNGKPESGGGRWRQTTLADLAMYPASIRGDILVLAHHPITDLEAADHRNPRQWRFYSVLAVDCPPNPHLMPNDVRYISADTGLEGLSDAISWSMMMFRGRSISAIPLIPEPFDKIEGLRGMFPRRRKTIQSNASNSTCKYLSGSKSPDFLSLV